MCLLRLRGLLRDVRTGDPEETVAGCAGKGAANRFRTLVEQPLSGLPFDQTDMLSRQDPSRQTVVGGQQPGTPIGSGTTELEPDPGRLNGYGRLDGEALQPA